MGSPRITKDMRQNIVTNTIKHQFRAEEDAIVKAENALAQKVYEAQYPSKKRDAMDELGKDFIDYEECVYVNMDGQRRQLFFGKSTNGQVIRKPGIRNPYYHAYAPAAKLKAEIDAFLNKHDDLEERLNQARISLLAVLESVQSFKKLRAVWPQGEKFYDMYDVDSETKSGVPAVVITDLNKMLGIK